MFVSSVDIKEFRGIKQCNSPLSLSKFTVLLGRNNSGKSSVLEALSLFPDYEIRKLYLDRGILDFLAKLHGGFSSLVYGYSGTAEIKCEIKNEKLTLKIEDSNEVTLEGIELSQEERVRIDNLRMVMPKDSRIQIERELYQKHLATLIEGSNSISEKLSNASFFIPNDTAFMDNLQTKIKDENIWNLITKSGANFRIIRLVNKCVDDKYTEILRTPELSARKERGKERLPLYVKVKDLGDGIQKVVTTALWLEALNPSLVLWDDFEGSAHPSLIKELLAWIAEKPWQVIMSTHSFDVLATLLDVRPKNSQVIQLKKTEDDILIQKTLSIEELEDIVDTSQDPRKMVDLLEL